MRLSFFHLFVLCAGSGSLGFYIMWFIPYRMRYIVRNTNSLSTDLTQFGGGGGGNRATNGGGDCRQTTARSLLSLIKEGDDTFSLEGFNGPLERLDILCWMYHTQQAKKRGLIFNATTGDNCLETPEDKQRNLVPKNVFYVIFGHYNFTFLNYMSMISIRKVVPRVNIYVVSDYIPGGDWWYRAINEVENVMVVYRTKVPYIFDRFIGLNEHVSDVVRLQILLLSGGIYLDPDVVFVRPVDDLRRPQLTMGLLDSATGMGNGLIFTKRHSRFLTYWYESYRTFDYKKWGVHSMKNPYWLSLIFTDLINVDKDRIYSPNWFESEKLFLKTVPWDKNIAVHIWHRHSYPMPKNIKDIARLNTTVGEILRHIYYGDKKMRRK